MRHWNYRVIRFEADKSLPDVLQEEYFAIHEVYYKDDGTPGSYGEYAACALWDEEGGGGNILDMMREALEKPVLTEEDFK